MNIFETAITTIYWKRCKKTFNIFVLLAASQHSYAIEMNCISTHAVQQNITHSVYQSSDCTVIAHVVTMPIKNSNLQLVVAQGQREEVSSIAQRTAGTVVAVNGSNYRRGGRYNGNRLNLLCTQKKIYADCQLHRGCWAWNNNTKTALISPLSLATELHINHKPFPVTGINQPRALGQSILYTDVADIQLLNYTPRLSFVLDADLIVREITSTAPRSIPSGWYMYQTDTQNISHVTKGMQASLEFSVFKTPSKEDIFYDYDFILEGAGLLVQDGKTVTDRLYAEFSQGPAVVHCHDEVAADFSTQKMQEWLIELRHPRTALGITQDNTLCIVVVDGRQEKSEGLTLHELAIFMRTLNCTQALNLGGGGCSTLYLDGKVINNPSAGEERPVSEALCFSCT